MQSVEDIASELPVEDVYVEQSPLVLTRFKC